MKNLQLPCLTAGWDEKWVTCSNYSLNGLFMAWILQWIAFQVGDWSRLFAVTKNSPKSLNALGIFAKFFSACGIFCGWRLVHGKSKEWSPRSSIFDPKHMWLLGSEPRCPWGTNAGIVWVSWPHQTLSWIHWTHRIPAGDFTPLLGMCVPVNWCFDLLVLNAGNVREWSTGYQ